MDTIQANPHDETEFASGSHDNIIKIWDAPTYETKLTIEGHSLGVWSLTYDHTDTSRLMSSSTDSTVKIWDLKTGNCTTTLNGHDHYCYKAKFDSAAQHVVTVGADMRLVYWDLRNTT